MEIKDLLVLQSNPAVHSLCEPAKVSILLLLLLCFLNQITARETSQYVVSPSEPCSALQSLVHTYPVSYTYPRLKSHNHGPSVKAQVMLIFDAKHAHGFQEFDS